MTAHKEIDQLAQAIYSVNRHAKVATRPQHLYTIKKLTIDKLLHEKNATKIGLHFSKNPKNSNQHSTLLIKVSNYYFHLPPKREDFKQLKHLGDLDEDYRNPQTRMSLSYAKKIIYEYIDWQPKQKKAKKEAPSYYTPSSLGQMKWPPTKRFD
ncbi:MAG TPA: YkyB family protein [Pseudogracilibacillus sp.]|nr:YkyB family protein [Pseudogracilibacillus sp.]